MVNLQQLVSTLDRYLQPALFKDYCPNGLQISGPDNIKKIVSGVTACQALLEQAVMHQADAVLVHHGYFWRGESEVLCGAKFTRIKTLIRHNIALIAYHLPLDAHPECGNNKQLAERLGIIIDGTLGDTEPSIIFHGHIEKPMSGGAFAQHITHYLQRQPLHIDQPARSIQRIAWCTGGAQDYINLAIAKGVDAYLTGEASERTVHSAREAGIHFFAAGHHATERYGVQALGDWIAKQFGIMHQFIDIDNPV
jgi:dinuclear metal center YbgI/SA1388 family protein